jgi:biopolymer transport protein ExbB/TolQ
MVAIPSFVAYRYLRGRVDSIVVQIERDVVRFADALNDRSDSGTERERA